MQKRKLERFYFRVAKIWGKSIISGEADVHRRARKAREISEQKRWSPVQSVMATAAVSHGCTHDRFKLEPILLHR